MHNEYDLKRQILRLLLMVELLTKNFKQEDAKKHTWLDDYPDVYLYKN
jgi:hypothetical protein